MEQAGASRYWCHMCSQRVNPISESEAMKCPFCGSGFIEEMPHSNSDSDSYPNTNSNANANSNSNSDSAQPNDSDRALSLWAPILLGMMANPIRPRPLMDTEEAEGEPDDAEANDGDQEAESLMRRRRRRSSAAILQLLQTIRAGMLAESAAADHNQERERDGRDGQRVILINPFNQTIVVQGERPPFGSLSLGDYFIGPGLDMLLQHLAENDPNRYGTPPAQKEAVDALPSVTIEEPMQCAICLDECDEGVQLKEMPCKHKFHDTCIVPWLDLHSSCPVCRYQLPADDSKLVSSENTITTTAVADNRNDNGRRFSVPLLWPFTALFPSHDASPPSATAEHDN